MSAASELAVQLHEWLKILGLGSKQADADRWCEEQGAAFLKEVVQNIEDFTSAIGLEPDEAHEVSTKAADALKVVLSSSQCRGAPLSLRAATVLSELSQGSGDSLSLRSATVLSGNSKDDSFPRLTMTCTFVADFYHTSTAPGTGSATPRSSSLVGEDVQVVVDGPLSCLVGDLPVCDTNLSIAEVQRDALHMPTRSDEPKMDKPSISTKKTKTPPNRVDTVGNYSFSPKREDLVELVSEDKTKPVNIEEGQTGTVFALEAGGQKVAVFKPMSGEMFKRRSISPGQGAIREEAVYIVDRLCGMQAHVPVTSRATLTIRGKQQDGAVQAFIHDVLGFVEDYGMPRSADKAQEFVTQETAEAVALLDMRVFNMDRHSGNLLLLGRNTPHTLGTIDHGCTFPPWWALSEAYFEAWQSWPQLQMPPSGAARALAQNAMTTLEQTCQKLEELGLEDSSIITLKICTFLVHVGVLELNIPVGRIASMMVRDEEAGFQKLSWLETKVLECACQAGCRCHLELDCKAGKVLVVDEAGRGLNITAFLEALERTFRSEMVHASA